MKNNRLTAKYIKDVFRFMEMYNINKIEVGVITLFIENNNYNYNIINENEHEWHMGITIQDLLESFKKSKLYMMELV